MLSPRHRPHRPVDALAGDPATQQAAQPVDSRPADAQPVDGQSHQSERRLAARLALGGLAAALVAIPFVLLMLLVLSEWEPLDRLDRGVADDLHDTARRSPGLVDALKVGSVVTDPWTLRVIVIAVAVWLWRRRAKRLAAWAVTTAVIGGVLSALLKLLVARSRPAFPEPVATAAGYSFPSGHALNSMLIAGILLLVFLPLLRTGGRVAAYGLAAVLVLFTGYDRIALGVHYVSDVLAGWVAALAVLAGTARAFEVWRREEGRRPSPMSEGLEPESVTSIREQDGMGSSGAEAEPRVKRAAVIYNPLKVPDLPEMTTRVESFMARAGWGEPLWLETTIDDPGLGMCQRAIHDECDVVFVCGGDGTVMAAVSTLAGCDIPLAILPAGTGNLLARNLDLPLDDEEEGLRIGTAGRTIAIDVGAVDERKFAVMAGLGFDAAIMRDAPEGLKKVVGWPAYLVSAVKHLRGRGIRVTLTIDEEPPMQRRVRTVVVGNVGRLQGNIPLMPDALFDDGLLDVVVMAPRNLLDWARVALRVLRRATVPDDRMERFRGRRVRIDASRPQPRQLDGDVIEDGSTMDIRVEPRALKVRVREESAERPEKPPETVGRAAPAGSGAR